MSAGSSTCSAIIFLSTLFTTVYSQGCGGFIEAGAGVIRSPNHSDGNPPSFCFWRIQSGVETRIRIRFKVCNCSGDILFIYDGEDRTLLGQFCDTNPPTSIESTGRFMAIQFLSRGEAENNQGFVITYESIDDAIGSRVIWSEILPATGKVQLRGVHADPNEMLDPDTVTTTTYYASSMGNWTALATNYGQHELMWSDGVRKVMISGTMVNNLQVDIFFAYISSNVLGVAVDWLTGNVYWTDANYDWIIMYNANGTRHALIINEDLDIPTGIAIHPSRGYLFWTDSGSRPKVERSNLAGGSRIELVTTDIICPSGITIDYETELLYWVDAFPSYNRIEVSDLDGGHRRTLMHSLRNLGLFDLTVSGNFIYTTAQETQTLKILEKDSGVEVFGIILESTPYSVVTYAPDVQPLDYSPCSSNPCSYLCVGGGPNGYTCLCENDFLLRVDGHTCENEGSIDPPQFFVASPSKLCRYPINFPDFVSSSAASFEPPCFFEGGQRAVAITVDVEDGVVFYSDIELNGIGMVTLRDGAPLKIIMGGVRDVHGLAVDWVTKNLYWTDFERNTIEVSTYNGSYRTTLINSNIIQARSIAIDPAKKFMFWAEFGPPPQIERASLDGTGRAVIVRTPYGLPIFLPLGLAIDAKEERLYYADLQSNTINKVDYFGNNKTEVLRKSDTTFFDIALYKDYILWTEIGDGNGIYAGNRHTGEVKFAYRPGEEQMFGITTYAGTRQKIMHHPCRYQNGGCEQLCLSSTSNVQGFVCVCTLGFYLAADGKSCVSDLVQDNFFLVTDTYRRAIFQVDLQSSLEPKALNLPGIQNPIRVTFDPVERKVYWTDVGSKTLSRAAMNGNSYQVIARNGVEDPDGMAVDSISRLLYWMDSGTQTLSVSHLDGSNSKILIRGLDKPRALVLHPVKGTMFWTDWGDNAVIERAFMDGTHRSVIVSGSLVWPNGLTIDYYDGDRLYWCDAGLERLETADFNGNGRRVVHAFGRDLHAYDVAVLGQFLYWTDWELQSVLKVDKNTGRGNVTVGPNDYARPNGIYMVSSATLPPGDHLCSTGNGGCTVLCLPSGLDTTCTCSDGYQFDLDGATCVPDQVTECPREFPNGFIDKFCEPRPGQICNVECLPGFERSIDAIVCQASGTWNRDDNTICSARQCPPLQTPPHAVQGPCSPPYTTGTMCTHICPAGYTRTGGNTMRLCDRQGEWTGTPLRCDPGPDDSFSDTGVTNPCNPDLEFIEEPRDLLHAEGDFVEPRCQVSDEDATITWFKDGQRLESDGAIGIIVDQFNELFILSFDSMHEGHYACVVLVGDTECLRAEANITLNPLGFFTDVPEDAYINTEVYDNHVFICTPKDETWIISWEKDGEPLENHFIRNGNLMLFDIREEDEGMYTCVVSDPRSQSIGRADAWLFLTDPPEIDISAVCGTITVWSGNIGPTPSPEVLTTTEDAGLEDGSVSWSIDGGIGLPSDGDINQAETRSSRIVGGTTATSGSAPFMVRITELRDREWAAICGGTLLDQRWVMTAAHCMFEEESQIPIRKENLNLLLGEYDTLTQEDSEMVRRPAEIIVHEEYNKVTFDNDIALIRIEPPLREFTPYIRPICLAPYTLSRRLMKTSTLGRVTGWGRQMFRGPRSRFLKEVMVPFVDRQTCEESVDENDHEFTNNMFCAGYHSAQQDACSGDSGGPLALLHDDGRWYQLGIVSWGIGCAEEGEYGFYTHVSRFLHWMRSKDVTIAYSPNVALRFNESNNSEVLAFAMRSRSNLTVASGSKVDLECIPNRDDASVEWFIGNNPVTPLEDGVRILPSGLVFRFDAIEERFSGAYSCESSVSDEDGEQVIRANFQIQVIPA